MDTRIESGVYLRRVGREGCGTGYVGWEGVMREGSECEAGAGASIEGNYGQRMRGVKGSGGRLVVKTSEG